MCIVFRTRDTGCREDPPVSLIAVVFRRRCHRHTESTNDGSARFKGRNRPIPRHLSLLASGITGTMDSEVHPGDRRLPPVLLDYVRISTVRTTVRSTYSSIRHWLSVRMAVRT